MDKIIISGIVVHTIIGVHEHEQTISQALSVTLSFSVDVNRAASNDTLSNTHDYSAIYQSTIAFIQKTHCRLLETLAKQLADYLKQAFQLLWLQVSIMKRPVDMPDVAGVTVVVER